MSREADLLFGMLALQLGFISKEQLLECAAVWMSGGAASLAGLLREKRFVRESQEAPLRALIEAQLKKHGGDVEKTLVSGAVEPSLRDELLKLSPAPEFERTMSALRGSTKRPARVVADDGDRYRLGQELGRGGLGRVVEAHDARLKRQVAVKLVLDGLPAELADRFVREAELAGRLEHPNIVPVYDFGSVAGDDGVSRPFMVMKRVRGRDLGVILKALRKGDSETRDLWSRMRLLQVFQDVCQGIAFAHDRGVVHRDLKPANVMLGDFGETLVLDWGLARVLSAAPDPASVAPGSRASGESSRIQLTIEGEVIGTPSYMPPEQAEGRHADIDHRSDIYSLGAILYEILTWHPPFEGSSVDEIISKVRSGRLTPPSRRVDDLGGSAPAPTSHTVLRASAHPGIPAPVPSELDVICLRALAFAPADRYSTAIELHHEVQLFIEGVREHERARRLADEAASRALVALDRADVLRASIPAATADFQKAREDLVRTPTLGKAALWAAQDAESAVRLDLAEEEARADLAATEALGHDASHPAARKLKAEVAWKRFEPAEAVGNAAEMLLHRRVVERYNDGPFDRLLRGDGTMTLRSRAFGCACLVEGRRFEPGEIRWEGLHPFSGRRMSGPPPDYGVAEYEPSSSLTLKAHGAGCIAEETTGAHVWLWKYEDEGRLRVPVTPPLAGVEGPAAPLDAAFEAGSPFRPRGPGLYLGRTPLLERTVPMGSWLALVAVEGRLPRRIPVRIPRCGAVSLDVVLFPPFECPDGVLPVQGGTFRLAGDRANPLSAPERVGAVGDFFLATHNVSCGEYSEFLQDLERENPGSAASRSPRSDDGGVPYWPGPPWEVPVADAIARMSPERAARVGRIARTPFDWIADWPVLGINWFDAMAWCRWKRGRDGRPWTIVASTGWERAARGDDQRAFPMGDSFDPRWGNMLNSRAGQGFPAVRGEFPHDEGPFGHRHICANVRTCCLNRAGPAEHDWRATRGGNWAESEIYARSSGEFVQATNQVTFVCGFRVALPIRLG